MATRSSSTTRTSTGFGRGQLLIATGTPGAGLDAQIVRTVPVVDLAFAETCERDDVPDSGTDRSECGR
jgi:hypothetical protein